MQLTANLLKVLTASAMTAGTLAVAQAPAAAPAPEQPAPAAAPAAAPDPKPWRVAGFDISGFADGFFTFNNNHPAKSADGQISDLYNFNDTANTPDLSAVKLTLNHDPAPVGAHFDFIEGRTNTLINAKNQLEFVEQAFVSVKPPKAKGFELDLGKWVTSAGAEVIEAKDNWNYSRSILFAWAIPYWHFGARTSMPVSKTETIGFQIYNGWNNITKDTGINGAFTSSFVKPKYTWNLNYLTGPNNVSGQDAYRNLVDTTVLLTPNAKFNAYINYDLGFNKNSITHGSGDNVSSHWQGVAFAAHDQFTGTQAVAGRFEVFNDNKGYATGTAQTVKEFTGTYEYHWSKGLISRFEYRHDFSDANVFHHGAMSMSDSQDTVTVGLIAIVAPKR